MRDYPGQSGTEVGQTPCLLGFLVAQMADGGSRLLVGVSPPFGDFRGGVGRVLTPGKSCFTGPLRERLGSVLFARGRPRGPLKRAGISSARSCRPAAWPASGRSTPAAGCLPARAGNTFLRLCRLAPESVHPRPRGEHVQINLVVVNVDGSSPPARGTRLRSLTHRLSDRFIPARAGNTPVAESKPL